MVVMRRYNVQEIGSGVYNVVVVLVGGTGDRRVGKGAFCFVIVYSIMLCHMYGREFHRHRPFQTVGVPP